MSERRAPSLDWFGGYSEMSVANERGFGPTLNRPVLIVCYAFVPMKRVKRHGSILLECYMGWFPSLICKNYIFKDFVKTIEATSLKFCMLLKLRTLHPEKTTAQVKFANCSNAHAQTFVLLNGEMAIVSACLRKLKFWLWLLWTVFFLMQTGFLKIGLNKLS